MAAPGQSDPNEGFSDDAKYIFVNGLTGPPMTGICASMPVLYIAIGWCLGDPQHLVSTKGYFFCRCEAGRARLNMEGTARGFGSRSDEEYMAFPLKVSDEEIAANRVLSLMSRSEELACFLHLGEWSACIQRATIPI